MANITVRVDEEQKNVATKILERMGVTMSQAVNLFLDELIRKDGFPFDITASSQASRGVCHMLDEVPDHKMLGTHTFAEALVASQVKKFLGATVTRINNDPVVDLVFTVGDKKYACLVKGRQFAVKESLQDHVTWTEVEQLDRFAQQEGCLSRIAFVMINCDGTDGNTYIFDPADLEDMSQVGVRGVTGSFVQEGNIRVSNAPRNRKYLQNNGKILSFYFRLGCSGAVEEQAMLGSQD